MLGMLPATVIYVNAGSQVISVEGTSDLLSWRIRFCRKLDFYLPVLAGLS